MEFDLARPKDWWRFVDTFLPDYARDAGPAMRGARSAMSARADRAAETWTASASRKETDQPDWDSDERDSDATEPIRRGPRVGRNERCPCGSGKKFKRCCGSSVDGPE